MTSEEVTGDKPHSIDIERYRANYLAEQEGLYLYQKLAEVESDAYQVVNKVTSEQVFR